MTRKATTQSTDPNPLLNAPRQWEREIIPASELKVGDFVDMTESNVIDPFPFNYTDPLAEYEMGHVDDLEWETDNCLVIEFDNLGAVAVSAKQQLVIAARPSTVLPYRPRSPK